MTVETRPATFAQAETVLAASLPGYAPRPQQQALASFVEDVIANGGHALAEAGCGTGKSLGVLIPAILAGKRVVVATATIALMEQYANKDVPFLQEHLGVPFTWALVKGRSNYFCQAKASTADTSRVPNLQAMLEELEADENHTGDREHFQGSITKEEFSYVASTSNECPGKKQCPFGDVCFAEKAKQKGKDAQVVITNTAMLLTDLKVREMTGGLVSMLGEYDLVIIDEAHETEDIATSQLSEQAREKGMRLMVAEATTFARGQGEELHSDGELLDRITEVWGLIADKLNSDDTRMRLSYFVENQDAFIGMIDALHVFADEVASIDIVNGDSRRMVAQRNRLVSRAQSNARKFTEAVSSNEDTLVRWVEKDEQRNVPVFATAPLSVGAYLNAWLWSQASAILVSATLSIKGDFGYVADRLGLPDTTETLNVGTPFNYADQSVLFVPGKTAPSPKDRNAWLGYASAMTLELVKAAGGGALLLFTSRQSMNNAYDTIGQSLRESGYTTFIQGRGSNKELAASFQDDTHSVLFALKSFFTGVDFQGETCRLVVMDKLPFPVPTDPIFAARCEAIDRYRPRASFNEMTIPAMSLTLQQGYGRLIRTTKDRGVVAILDSRLSSTGYGRNIVNSLPPAPVTNDLSAVQEFFA